MSESTLRDFSPDYPKHTNTTMLSITPQDLQHQTYYLPFRPATHRYSDPTPPPFLNNNNNNHNYTFASMSSSPPSASSPIASQSPQDATIAQALEIARESPNGASDPTISKILEGALSQIWGKVQAQPDSYVMSRDEFAVFNFFQYRFIGDKTAVSARKRFWDNCRVV